MKRLVIGLGIFFGLIVAAANAQLIGPGGGGGGGNSFANGLTTGASPPTCTAGTGGALCLSSGTAPTGQASVGQIYMDSTKLRLEQCNNNGACNTISTVSATWGFGASTVAAATTVFLANGSNPTIAGNATETNVQELAPCTGTMINLYVKIAAAANANTPVFTVSDNAAGTTLTCTIANTATTCNDTTHAPTVTAGDAITLKVANPAAANATGLINAGFAFVC